MIVELELDGYNRFFLNNIQNIVYTPESQIQLILGSNGSGKSSLLKELNPLPINKHEFKEDGFKRYKDTRNNNNYEIYSDKSKCSFKVNDEELNPGGTKKIQLKLIEDHFNLTPKNNNVLLNISKLTTMSTNERKEWLRQMSTVDYAYSIFLYNEVKQKLRDSVGFVKIINNELTEDTKLLIKEEELETIKKEIVFLKESIEEITLRYSNENIIEEIINPDYDELIQFDKLLSKGIDKFNRNDILVNINSINIKEIEKEIEIIQKEIDNIEILNRTTEEIEVLKKSILEKENYFSTIKEYYKGGFNLLDSLTLYNNYKNEDANIINIITELSNYDDVMLDKDEFKILNDNIVNVRGKLESKTRHLNRLTDELTILMDNKKDENKISCHKCGAEQYFGYNENKEKELKENITKTENEISIIRKQLDEYLVVHNKCDNKINLIKLLKDLYVKTELSGYWNLHLQEAIGKLTGTQIFIINNNLRLSLEACKDYKENYDQLQDMQYKLKVDKEILELQNKTKESSKDKLLSKLEKYVDLKREKLLKLDFYNNLLKDIDSFITIKENLNTVLKKHNHNVNIIVTKNKNDLLKKIIIDLKTKLLELEDKYSNYDRIKSRIIKNKELIEKHELNKTLLEKTLKALSPNEGLIAKSINGFINKFLTEMNAIINSVWSYEIVLLPCQINEDNDLDYQFSVLVDNNQTIDDVSNLSSSMKDIIDLSFRIIFMKYMGLSDMPLILDEFGITMDDKHRFNVYSVIENTLANNFSQLFITAHFKSMYSRFLDSDIVVLDDKNLDLDKTSYNTCIKIN